MKFFLLLPSLLKSFFLLLWGLFALPGLLTAQTCDETFRPIIRGNPDVKAVAAQLGGKLILMGRFNYLEQERANSLCRLNSDGTPDFTFRAGLEANTTVQAMALQPDGKIVLSISLPRPNQPGLNRVIRLSLDGAPDPTFTPIEANGVVRAFALQENGNILVGGSFTALGGQPMARVARLLPNGTLDPDFYIRVGIDGSIRALAAQKDGKVLIGGIFSTAGNSLNRNLARLLPNGTMDPDFHMGTGADQYVEALAIQENGMILLAAPAYNHGLNRWLHRLKTDGSIDPTFLVLPQLNGVPRSIAVQPDGKIVAAGMVSYLDKSGWGVVRLNEDGAKDPGFNKGPGIAGDFTNSAFVQPDKRVVIVGNFEMVDGIRRLGVARIQENGSLDAPFFPKLYTEGSIRNMVLQQTGNLVLEGDFATINGEDVSTVMRLTPGGAVDPSFQMDFITRGHVGPLAVQSDNKILIMAAQGQDGGQEVRLNRLLPNGPVDPSFILTYPMSTTVSALAVQHDDKILVGGNGNHTGQPLTGLARLNPDGSFDATFSVGTGLSNTVNNMKTPGFPRSIALQQDHKILIGGVFNLYNGVSVNRLARLNPNGSLDEGFNFTDTSFEIIHSVAVRPDRKIMVTGTVKAVNGMSLKRTVRLHPDGSIDLSFDNESCEPTTISFMAVESNSSMLLGGTGETGNQHLYRVMSMETLATPAAHLPQGETLLFPNPTAGNTTLRLTNPQRGPVQVTVRNLLGQEVRAFTLLKEGETLEHAVSLDDLSRGLYLVSVSQEKFTQTRRVSKR